MPKCSANHANIQRPTRCIVCGEFVCNKCEGRGAPFGCRGARHSENGKTYYGCGRRLAHALCSCGGRRAGAPTLSACLHCDHGDPTLAFSYRDEHPHARNGSAPCEACICGLWSRATCPACHGVGAPNGACICGRLLKAEHAEAAGAERVATDADHALRPYVRSCDFYETACRRGGVVLPDGFCSACFAAKVGEWKTGVAPVAPPTAPHPVAPPTAQALRPRANEADSEPDSADEIARDVETIIRILRKYPAGTISIVDQSAMKPV
jgi:hypothetical protein